MPYVYLELTPNFIVSDAETDEILDQYPVSVDIEEIEDKLRRDALGLSKTLGFGSQLRLVSYFYDDITQCILMTYHSNSKISEEELQSLLVLQDDIWMGADIVIFQNDKYVVELCPCIKLITSNGEKINIDYSESSCSYSYSDWSSKMNFPSE